MCYLKHKGYQFVGARSVSDRAPIAAAKDGIAREVWDLTRLTRTCGATGDDKLSIDFSGEFGQTLPCLVTDRALDGIQVLFTCVPGAVLAQIYSTYRARLLERNVRSFLQFNGKINKGIRDALLNSPSRFLPYNNGLSATASQVDLEALNGGLARIRAVHDFQIVNGDQTTASIAATARRDGADLAQVTVPMKLTVVPAGQVDDLVPLISKFANTQNRIQEADFSANHPWHIELERISRSKWTQPTEDSPRGTRWFYERSRGQYADELAATNTTPGRKRFRNENPPRQKITKTDLAKFVMSWDQRPAVVSRGAQKCFMDFMNQLVREGRKSPTVDDFERIVAQAILFDAAERLYGELDFKGYRAQVVTYAIARLSHALQRKLPWKEIWLQQRIPDDMVQPLKTILIGVRNIILQPPNNRNITEWCKREECWSEVLNLELELPLNGSAGESNGEEESKPEAVLSPVEIQLIEAAKSVPAEVWFDVAGWAKETQSLKPWQRAISFSLGRLLTQGRPPSAKQARQGCILILGACGLGFTHDQLSKDVINPVKAAIAKDR